MNIHTFKAFRSPNYRLFFSGQSVSLVGTWMQRTALYWIVYIQTGSALILGITVFAAQFPSFLFSPLGGIVADRYNRYRVLMVTQVASMIQAILLTILVMFTSYSVWEIIVLSAVLGTINAFDVPARQSMIFEIIDDKEDLPNAIALNSSMANLAWLVGPALSGIALEWYGAGVCFLINALSFGTVIFSLLLMKLPDFTPRVHSKRVINEFREGWQYLKRTPSIGLVILLLSCVSLFVLPFSTLLPVYAKVVFEGNASTFGYLNSAIGLGAVAGTIFLASLKANANLKRILMISLLLFGTGLILLSHMTNLSFALLFSMLIGFGTMSQTTISNSIIQTTVSKEMRGRVISFFAMAYFGMQPIGGLLIGGISQYVGAPNTILVEGISAIVIAFIFLPFLRGNRLKEEDRIKLLELGDPNVNTDKI